MARRPSPSLRALLFWCGEGAVSEAFGDNVRQWGPWPAGPVRPSGPCSFGVAKVGPVARRPSPSLRALQFWRGEGAVCEAFGDWKTAQTASFLVGSETTLGSGARGPQAQSVPQGRAVLVWRRRRL